MLTLCVMALLFRSSTRMLAGSIRESLRRASVLCDAAPSATRTALRERLEAVEWGEIWNVEQPLFEQL